jgi:hypothetical protein
MSIGSILSRVVPTAIGFATGGPAGAATALYGTETAKRQEARIKRQVNRENERIKQEMEIFNTPTSSLSTIQRNLAATQPVVSTASSGGGFLSTLRSGIRDVSGIVSDVFASGIPQFFGVNRPPSVIQQPAVTTTTKVGAQESQGSGSIEAGMGAALPSIIAGARNLLKSPGGQLAIGTGTGLAFGQMGSAPSGMRMTRKMKSQARMVLNMTGGNLQAAADILGIDQNTLVMILLKRFRNDGPVVTKAALRKTKQTIRRLHNMQDVLKSITPTATRRRTPMKRASTTTLIKN